jgi:hypothetical protein
MKAIVHRPTAPPPRQFAVIAPDSRPSDIDVEAYLSQMDTDLLAIVSVAAPLGSADSEAISLAASRVMASCRRALVLSAGSPDDWNWRGLCWAILVLLIRLPTIEDIATLRDPLSRLCAIVAENADLLTEQSAVPEEHRVGWAGMDDLTRFGSFRIALEPKERTRVAVGAAKRNNEDTSLQVGNETQPLDSTDTRGLDDDLRARSMIQTLREMLARQGVCESYSGDQEGFYFGLEDRGEISLRYNDVEREGVSTCATPLRRNEAGLLKFCYELALRGYAFTLIMSPRTLALHVQCD